GKVTQGEAVAVHERGVDAREHGFVELAHLLDGTRVTLRPPLPFCREAPPLRERLEVRELGRQQARCGRHDTSPGKPACQTTCSLRSPRRKPVTTRSANRHLPSTRSNRSM